MLPGQIEFNFDGATFDAALDGDRLRRQLAAVRQLMFDSQWRTLADISAAVGAPEASVSARLRDLRKPKFGGYTVERRRHAAGGGLHEYRLRWCTPQPKPDPEDDYADRAAWKAHR